MRYIVALLMLLAVGNNAIGQSDDDSPKAGLTGNLLDERGVRKEREERATSDSIGPSVIATRLEDSAGENVNGDVTSTLPLEHRYPDGKRRRFLGKTAKLPAEAKAEKASAPVEDVDDVTADEYQVDDDTMQTYANAKVDKRRNKRGGGRRNKNGRDKPKKKRRNGGGKSTGRRAPRKRFAIHGGKGRKL